MTKNRFILITMISFILLSCQNDNSSIKIKSVELDSTKVIVLTKTVDTSFYKESIHNDSCANYSVSFKYVQFDSNHIELNKSIEKLVFDSLGSEKNYVRNSLKDYKEYFKDASKNDIFTWTDEKELKVKLNSNYLISFIYTNVSWRSGGSIGYGSNDCYIYDVKKKHLISFSDLIDTTKVKELQKVLEDCYRETLPKSDKTKSLKALGWDTYSIGITKNIYIDINGVNFLYNRFEDVPFAPGLLVSIPFRKALKFLNKNTILTQHFKNE